MNVTIKSLHATKWSIITEITGKIITPISSIILARILTPDSFGILAVVIMLISFANMFSDAGFSNTLIQRDFENEEEKSIYASVAFWSSFGLAFFLCALITFFRIPLASFLGISGYQNVISAASLILPLTTISSIQTALYRRNLDFRSLFYRKVIGCLVPFVVTIPLALFGLKYWSLIIGTIAGKLCDAVVLTTKSKWKPVFFFDFHILRNMVSFSFWSFLESFSIWISSNAGVFLIGFYLDLYFIGLYKTAIGTVNDISTLITLSTSTVLFSTLSRLKNDPEEFSNFFLHFRRSVSIITVPLGVGIFLYKEMVTQFLLGEQWRDASMIIGLNGLMIPFTILFNQYISIIYRAKGKPRITVIHQIIFQAIMIPSYIFSLRHNFSTFIFVQAFIIFFSIFEHMIILKLFFDYSPFILISNIFPSLVSASVMATIALLLKSFGSSIIWNFISIFFCIIIYFSFLFLFRETRNLMKEYYMLLVNKKNRI